MRFLFISGLILFLGSIGLIIGNYDEIKVDRNGKIVKMQIEKLPQSCIGAKVRYYVTYSYKGELYDKSTRGDFCQKHHVGELIDMKLLEGSKTILRPDESAMMQILSSVALGILGLVISIMQWRKMRS